tara:strand:- start:360 stop:737 length:378 start_codon:yes stop_codon:yes gene_type:complete
MEFKEELITIPIRLLHKQPKRKNKAKLTTIYYYKHNNALNRKQQTKAKIVATSKYFYKQNLFYKDTILSNSNAIFDYYKVLKPELPDKVAVKNMRVRSENNKKKLKHYTFNRKTKEGEPIMVRFD